MITCEEFMAFNTPPDRLLSISRGERAACVKHMIPPCKKCCLWLASREGNSTTTEEDMRIDRVRYEDFHDPEFRKAAGLPDDEYSNLTSVKVLEFDTPEELLQHMKGMLGL